MIQKRFRLPFISTLLFFLLTISAFATDYAYVTIPGTDVIKIYNYGSNSLYAVIELNGGIGGTPKYTVTSEFETADQTTPDDETIVAMAMAPTHKYLYFATDKGPNTAGNLYQLNIIKDDDNPTPTVTLLGQVGIRPKDLVVDSTLGAYVYVANFGDNTVSKYYTTTGVMIQLTGFYRPIAMAVTSGNLTRGSDLFVANYEQNASGQYIVTMYNPSQGNIPIPVTNAPTDIAATMDNEFVYVCNSSATSGLISVIKPADYNDYDDDGDPIVDLDENTVIDTIEIPDAIPTRMAIAEVENSIYAIDPVFTYDSQDGTNNYAIAPGGGKMSVIDCSGRTNGENSFSRTVTTIAYEDVVAENPPTTPYSGGISITATRNGAKVFTVTGAEESFFITDATSSDLRAIEFDTTLDTEVPFGQIILSGVMPSAATELEADTVGWSIELKWVNNADDEIGFFIFRRDNDNDLLEYKFHLVDTVLTDDLERDKENPLKVVYKDDPSVNTDFPVYKGHRYDYLVVPYNEITRSTSGTSISIKAADDDESKICFISGTATISGLPVFITGCLIIIGMMAVAVRRKV